MSTQRLKLAAILSFVLAMTGLLAVGIFANRDAPPYPGKVLALDNTLLFEKSDILAGQDIYQRYGLMDHGSVWGHGSQRGPEFSALTLHIIGETVRQRIALERYGDDYDSIGAEERDIVAIWDRLGWRFY